MADKPTCASLKVTADLQAAEIKSVTHAAQAASDKADTLRDKVEDIRAEHGGEIKLLKDQVAELKADNKARDGHDGDIKTLKEQVGSLRDEVKFWRDRVVYVGIAVILLLIGILFKK